MKRVHNRRTHTQREGGGVGTRGGKCCNQHQRTCVYTSHELSNLPTEKLTEVGCMNVRPRVRSKNLTAAGEASASTVPPSTCTQSMHIHGASAHNMMVTERRWKKAVADTERIVPGSHIVLAYNVTAEAID